MRVPENALGPQEGVIAQVYCGETKTLRRAVRRGTC